MCVCISVIKAAEGILVFIKLNNSPGISNQRVIKNEEIATVDTHRFIHYTHTAAIVLWRRSQGGKLNCGANKLLSSHCFQTDQQLKRQWTANIWRDINPLFKVKQQLWWLVSFCQTAANVSFQPLLFAHATMLRCYVAWYERKAGNELSNVNVHLCTHLFFVSWRRLIVAFIKC